MIAIVDYGLGNVRAFANIYKKLNVPFITAKREEDLRHATKLILPGVGAFDHAMQLFTASGMREAVEDLVLTQNRPLIGVCVGMQMLARDSDEGMEPGLNWIPGHVRKLDASLFEYRTKLPHMGWNDVMRKQASPLLKGSDDRGMFYFLHSYYFDCDDAQNVLATANYGMEFAAIINHKNIYGIQCHPEKSHDFGIAILKNFSEL
jgi:glutamine amidotransferase